MQDTGVAITTRGGATTREDCLRPQIQLDGTKKVWFDIDAKKDTFFKAQDEMHKNSGKLPIYEIPTAFDSNLEVGPSRQHGTL